MLETALRKERQQLEAQLKQQLEAQLKEELQEEITQHVKKDERMHVAKAMLAKGMSTALIAEITQLSEEEILRL